MPPIKTLLANSALIVVTAAAVGLAGLRAKQWWDSQHQEPPRRVEDWQGFASTGQTIGPDDAAVTIVEFADYECPFCRLAAAEIRQILKDHPKSVRLVYRHYPLSFHPQALPSTRAALCAGEQRRFPEYHDLLYDSATVLDSLPWVELARRSRMPDIRAFEDCIGRETPLLALALDTVAGNALDLRGTPMFLVNDLRLAGYPKPGYIERYVKSELRRAGGRE